MDLKGQVLMADQHQTGIEPGTGSENVGFHRSLAGIHHNQQVGDAQAQGIEAAIQ